MISLEAIFVFVVGMAVISLIIAAYSMIRLVILAHRGDFLASFVRSGLWNAEYAETNLGRDAGRHVWRLKMAVHLSLVGILLGIGCIIARVIFGW